MFFPSCHTHLEALGAELAASDPGTFYTRNQERQQQLVRWQSAVYQRQVYTYNLLLMVVLVAVVVLVTAVTSFNYNTNVVSSFWFPVLMSQLLLSGAISILLTWALTRAPPCPAPAPACPALLAAAGRCLLSLLLVLTPVIILLVIFSSVPRTDPFIFLINQEPGRDHVDLSIITAFPVRVPGPDKMAVARGTLEAACFIDEQSDFRDKILLINATKPQCRSLLAEPGFYSRAVAASASGLILLDDTPRLELSMNLRESLHNTHSEHSVLIDS